MSNPILAALPLFAAAIAIAAMGGKPGSGRMKAKYAVGIALFAAAISITIASMPTLIGLVGIGIEGN